MSKEIKADDVIFNFFKQICDEKSDEKCVELGDSWINAMETNLINMEKNLEEIDKAKYHNTLIVSKVKMQQIGVNTLHNVWWKF